MISNIEIFAELASLIGSDCKAIPVSDIRLQAVLRRKDAIGHDQYLQGVMVGNGVVTVVTSKTEEIDFGFGTASANTCGLCSYPLSPFLALLEEAMALPAPAGPGADQLTSLKNALAS